MRCRAFFITYEKDFPYGCRTFGMKSKLYPSLEVRRASGSECHAFEPKPRPPRRPERPHPRDDDATYA